MAMALYVTDPIMVSNGASLKIFNAISAASGGTESVEVRNCDRLCDSFDPFVSSRVDSDETFIQKDGPG